ncbi:MAG: glycosyltransferase [Spirochaetes bacterium]|nr:glycosyltransferase [Spirochaetota bacterium]
MPYFSVIIPTHNRCAAVRRAVDSVLSQKYRDFELIVVDDGSDDGTDALAVAYGGALRYLRQENRGVSAARNRGIAAAGGEYIAFLDSDDLWLPGKLAAQRDFIAAHGEFRIHQAEEVWIRNGRRVNPRLRHLKRQGLIFSESLDLCLISPSAVAMHRTLFDEYGTFDERLPACEDYDLWLRITLNESVGLLEKHLVVRHGGHDDQLSRRYWGMDRFRIYAIVKLLAAEAPGMPAELRRRAHEVLMEKLGILHEGSLKRGNEAYAAKVGEAIRNAAGSRYSSIDRQSLLEG